MDPSEMMTTEANRSPALYQPQSLDQAMKLSEYLAKSGLVPDALKGKATDIMVVMMTAHDLGMSVTEGFRAIHVIKGRPTLSAAYRIARTKAHPDIEYFRLVQSDDARATWEARRKGDMEPTRITFTIEQAKAAGLTAKDNWRSFPAAMLRARAGSALADVICPDGIYGLPATEEIEDLPDAPHLPRDVTPPQAQTPAIQAPSQVQSAVTEAELVGEPAMAPTQPDEATSVDPTEHQTQLFVTAIAAAKTASDLSDLAASLVEAPMPVRKSETIRAAYAARKAALLRMAK